MIEKRFSLLNFLISNKMKKDTSWYKNVSTDPYCCIQTQQKSPPTTLCYIHILFIPQTHAYSPSPCTYSRLSYHNIKFFSSFFLSLVFITFIYIILSLSFFLFFLIKNLYFCFSLFLSFCPLTHQPSNLTNFTLLTNLFKHIPLSNSYSVFQLLFSLPTLHTQTNFNFPIYPTLSTSTANLYHLKTPNK